MFSTGDPFYAQRMYDEWLLKEEARPKLHQQPYAIPSQGHLSVPQQQLYNMNYLPFQSPMPQGLSVYQQHLDQHQHHNQHQPHHQFQHQPQQVPPGSFPQFDQNNYMYLPTVNQVQYPMIASLVPYQMNHYSLSPTLTGNSYKPPGAATTAATAATINPYSSISLTPLANGVDQVALQPMNLRGTNQELIEKLQLLLPLPPLSKAVLRPDVSNLTSHKRAKRKSKFTEEQDRTIVTMKRQGHSWVAIADATGVGSYLAARNRYQVIVGQQGSKLMSSWSLKDRKLLQNLLDDAEINKWEYIASKLSKATGKHFTAKECRKYVRHLFWMDPAAMGVTMRTVAELEKENEITRKLLKQEAMA